MIHGITDSNQFIYHYTTYDTAKNFILKNSNIKLSEFLNTNDPKETKDWEFTCGSNINSNLSNYNTSSISKWMSKSLKEGTRVACFCKDEEGLTGDYIKDIYKRGFAKPKMWLSYGDNHSGVCLVFDKELIKKAVNEQISLNHWTICNDVSYRNRELIHNLYDPDDQQYVVNLDFREEKGKEAYVSIHVNHHHKRLFFEKMEDWSNENEWRVVSFCNPKDTLFLSIEDAIVGIIYGDKVTEKKIRELQNTTNKFNLKHGSLKWKNCVPLYERVDRDILDWGSQKPLTFIKKVKSTLKRYVLRKGNKLK